MEVRSSNSLSLEVVNLSQRMGRSSRWILLVISAMIVGQTHALNELLTSIPWPLSVIWSSFRPPSLMRTSIVVEPASTAFSMSSFSACIGATMISPAAILFTTSGSKACVGFNICSDSIDALNHASAWAYLNLFWFRRLLTLSLLHCALRAALIDCLNIHIVFHDQLFDQKEIVGKWITSRRRKGEDPIRR